MSAMGIIMFSFIPVVSLVTMPGYTYTLGGERGKPSRQRTRMPLARDFSQEESQANLYILSTEEGTVPSITNCGC